MKREMAEQWLGFYLPENLCDALQKAWEYDAFLGRKITILSFYESWGSGYCKPDILGIEQVLRNGYVPMITWEPWALIDDPEKGGPENQPDFSLAAILNGKYDAYIRGWALGLKDLSAPVFLRLMHEMNGNWYPWCGRVNGNRPENYVAAWRYIRAIFHEVGNEKVIWVWSPYVHSVPDEQGNEIYRYFPGVEEVDWLALDGYNWGNTREWSRWQSFEDIFIEGYRQLDKLAPGKPMMIAETGSTEEGGDKSKWIEEAFLALNNRFVGIKALVWFNIDKECDWRIESSQKSAESFKLHGIDWMFGSG